MTITVKVRDRAWALKSTLDDSYGRRWQDVHNDTGSGSFSVQNDDPDLGAVDYGDIVEFSINGTARFNSLVEKIDRVAIAPGEEVDEATAVSGRGHLAVLEEAVVQPIPFGLADVRRFDYSAPELDDSGWVAATEIEQGQGITGNVRGDMPDGWPDDQAWWIWDRNSSTTPGATAAPEGDVYFRKEVTVAATGTYRVFITCDNSFELSIDGARVLADDPNLAWNWMETKKVDLFLVAGTHLFALRCHNLPPGGDNPAALILSVYAIDREVLGANLVRSDDTWMVLGYPADPPGFTPGEVLRILVDEAQDRGSLTGVVLGCDDDDDSDGDPWAATGDIALQVGKDYLSVIRQLCEVYMDARMRVGSLTLDAFVSRGQAQSVSLTEGGNLTELRHAGSV